MIHRRPVVGPSAASSGSSRTNASTDAADLNNGHNGTHSSNCGEKKNSNGQHYHHHGVGVGGVGVGVGVVPGLPVMQQHHYNPSSNSSSRPVKRLRRKKKGKKRSHLVSLTTGQVALVALIFILFGFVLSNFVFVSKKKGQQQQEQQYQNRLPLSFGDFQSTFDKAAGRHYHIPGSMPNLGDKSAEYAELRFKYDRILPPNDPQRSRRAVEKLKQQQHSHNNNNYKEKEEHYTNYYKPIMDISDVGYDIYNCPDEPPHNYPTAWHLTDIIDNWNPHDPEPRRKARRQHQYIYQGLCVFDYQTEYDKAVAYREAELPFVVQNDPDVMTTVERWNYPNYIQSLLGDDRKYHTEYSENNHFMYWRRPKGGLRNKNKNKKKKKVRHGRQQQDDALDLEHWVPPTKNLNMPYKEWLEHANVTDDSKLGPDNPHWYFRLTGWGDYSQPGGSSIVGSEFIFDELTFFQPRQRREEGEPSSSSSSSSLYVVDPDEQKGIHCRFGMKGVIAENHFDAGRNFIVLLGGERRYILSHPDQCDQLALFPRGHPSARHSQVDWSNPDLDEFPQFADATGNEIVLQAGDALYLPTHWFHFIVSLGLNMQCNTRSGESHEYNEFIHYCGF